MKLIMTRKSFKYIQIFLLLTILAGIYGCREQLVIENPASEGFNMAGSDPQAIEIADKVMQAMGGRKAWDQVKTLQWTFFGRRTHLWDKELHTVHIDVPGEQLSMDLSILDKTGTVIKNNETLSDTDSIAHYLDQAYKMWINDSYWLVMPFKLKDSGVTLKYLDPDTTVSGLYCDVLQMTFDQVGVTPDNKYLIYVDTLDHLVKQWDFYTQYTDSLPRFQSLWANYQSYGPLLLSGAEINNNRMTDIKVSYIQ